MDLRGSPGEALGMGVYREEGKYTPRRKRPPNGYLLFCLEKRTELIVLNPNVPSIAISKMLGTAWKNMTPAQQAPYKIKAQELQANFKKKYPNYKYINAHRRRKNQNTGSKPQNTPKSPSPPSSEDSLPQPEPIDFTNPSELPFTDDGF